jgi:HEAT repeat protein
MTLAFSGLGVLAVVAWKSWPFCVEHWYIAKLDSEDRGAREDAVAKLSGMASARAVPYLIQAIARRSQEEGEPFVDRVALSFPRGFPTAERASYEQSWRRKCSKAIEAAGIEALPGLEGKLRSKDPIERLWAAHQIGQLGLGAATTTANLYPLLSDEDPRVRRWAARALGSIGSRSPAVLQSLGEALRTRANPPDLRESCVEALLATVQIAGERFVLPSIRIRSGVFEIEGETGLQPEELRLEALENMSLVLSILAEAICEEDEAVRPAIIRAFFVVLRSPWLGGGYQRGNLRFDPQPLLLRLAADRDAAARGEAARFLARAATFDEPTLAALAGALGDRESSVRMAAASELKARGSFALPAWMAALKSGIPVHPETADALASMGAEAERCWPFLLERLPGAQEDSVGSLGRALGRIGSASGIGVPELASALKSSSSSARRGAAEALGHYGAAASQAGPALLEALDDEDPSVRTLAAFSLVAARGVAPEALAEKAVPILSGCLSDDDPSVRRRAGEALGALGPAARAATAALIIALRNEHEQVNDWALLALGEIGPDAWAAVPAVLSILKADDGQDLRDAFRVIKAIGREPELTIPVLRRYLTEPHALYTAFAADSLTAFGEKSLPALMDALSSENERVRDGAIRSLGRLGPAGRVALPALARVEAEDPVERLRVQAGLARERIAAEPGS